MGIETEALAVTDVAAALPVTEADYTFGYEVVLSNVGANIVYIGKLGVTSATGFPIAAGAQSPVIKMSKGQNIYAICAGGLTSTLRAFETGV